MRNKSIMMLGSLAACALQALAPHAMAQVAKQRVPVTSNMVVAALAAKGLPSEGTSVKISAPMTAASERPMLQVDTVTATASHTAKLRMVCSSRGDCLPFFADVTWPDSVDARAIASEVKHPQHLSAKTNVSTGSSVEQASLAMSTGTQAVLLIEDQRVHVSVHVVALESGSTGDIIHVVTPDHKQRFVASVVDGGLLKGHF